MWAVPLVPEVGVPCSGTSCKAAVPFIPFVVGAVAESGLNSTKGVPSVAFIPCVGSGIATGAAVDLVVLAGTSGWTFSCIWVSVAGVCTGIGARSFSGIKSCTGAWGVSVSEIGAWAGTGALFASGIGSRDGAGALVVCEGAACTGTGAVFSPGAKASPFDADAAPLVMTATGAPVALGTAPSGATATTSLLALP